jgi:predicted MFS family arabinose efflux permease
VVTRAELPQATAQNEAGFFTCHIIGPPVGTVLFQALGRAAPFVANAITYAVSLASLMAIRTPFHVERVAGPRNLRAEVGEGLRWIWAQPLIRYMAFLTGALNLINAAFPLVMIVLAKRLGADDAAIGAIFSGAGIGGILGSLVGGRIARRFTFGQVIIGIMWIEAMIFPLYAVVPAFPLLAAVAAAFFFLSPAYNVVQFSYRVALIPDELQGRVNSVFRLLAFGFMPVGAALSGVLIERLGVEAAVYALAGWLAIFAIATTFNRHVRDAKPLS